MTITDEAVEAAARAMAEALGYRMGDTEGVFWSWFQDSDDFARLKLQARAALTAALPFLTDIAQLTAERDGYRKHLDACEQIAGKALGYPWFMNDQANFPGATEADGVCIGEHVGDTIVEELANRLKAIEAERDAAVARPVGGEPKTLPTGRI